MAWIPARGRPERAALVAAAVHVVAFLLTLVAGLELHDLAIWFYIAMLDLPVTLLVWAGADSGRSIDVIPWALGVGGTLWWGCLGYLASRLRRRYGGGLSAGGSPPGI